MTGLLRTIRRVLFQHGLWLTAILTVGVFFGLFFLTDAAKIASVLLNIDVWRLGAVLTLVTISYGIRFVKWEYYLYKLEIEIPLGTSLLVFVSGLMMTVTPGKAGEVWKAWFLRDLRGVPVSHTASVVSAERVTDLLALSTFALFGLIFYQQSSLVLVITILFIVVGITLLYWRDFCLRIIELLETLPVVGSYTAQLESFYNSAYSLLQLKPLGVACLISLLAWGLEGVALWVVLEGLSAQATLLTALFVFGFGSVVGAASLLPGGLAAAEASMIGMLVVLGYSQTLAVSATLVIRAGTLWYGALLGTCVFVAYRFHFRDADF